MAFEQCQGLCTWGMAWGKTQKIDAQKPSCSGKDDFHLRKCPGVLAAACISVCRGSARHSPFSLGVFLHNRRFSIENQMWWFQQVVEQEFCNPGYNVYMFFPSSLLCWCLLMLYCTHCTCSDLHQVYHSSSESKHPSSSYKEMSWAEEKHHPPVLTPVPDVAFCIQACHCKFLL